MGGARGAGPRARTQNQPQRTADRVGAAGGRGGLGARQSVCDVHIVGRVDGVAKRERTGTVVVLYRSRRVPLERSGGADDV